MVTASHLNLLGHATTASQGSITEQELRLRPAYRVGELLEAVPGLVATVHSGEGKANQFLMRGFNLDHGTDLATFVDGIPINEVTHAHGQGYTDLNFLIPEMMGTIDYTKGPFNAATGDFGVAGSDRIHLVRNLPTMISGSVDTLENERLVTGGTAHFHNNDRLLGVFETDHADGPWKYPDNFRAIKSMARYLHGTSSNGFDLTGMYYRGQWRATNDQPLEAIQQHLIGRYGSLDPTDGGFTERYSLSGHYRLGSGHQKWVASFYADHSRLSLWNNFTHYLTDPVEGDQFEQDETRTKVGGTLSYTRTDMLFGRLSSESIFGIDGRYDTVFIDRRHTHQRTVLSSCPDSPYGGGLYVCNADTVQEGRIAGYLQNTTHWLPWMRTVFGLRQEYYHGNDHSLVTGISGRIGQTLFQPKGSLIFGPWRKTELYLSVGRGFHSNDLRGVVGTFAGDRFSAGTVKTPLMTKAISEEIGIRSNPINHLETQLSFWRIDFNSELTYAPDEGVNEAGPASRRQGMEFSAQYNPLPWLELNTDVAYSHARYRTHDPAYYGIDGTHIANAPNMIWSFGILLDNRGPWFGGLQVRWLGGYPLLENNSLRSKGYREVNLDIGYRFSKNLKLTVSVFNLTNSHDNAIEYGYNYRITPTAKPTTGASIHPLEPVSARFALSLTL
ncbi:TonB-dependent receptor [Acetobacter sp.]|uniref:TonB-dependent receptor n=1 Tax=Acetobacter sp. TaxID=440 RepID=UPI0025C373C5|nr:TonB-dependent receptor [Acetobacter sp.]MCH4090602.1 TonB-dependent receptor [Acetobacter sp.]MCI1300045.1 TonB-dependent receptor [Acetobacter sp.]MCI1316463.1 TonB-dependent receptor [Acetobacter sp.]